VAFDINERLNYAWEWAKNQKSRKPKPNPTDRTDRADRTDKMVWDRKLCNGCCQISRSMGANLSLATMLMCAADTSISIAYKMRFFNFNLNTQCMAGGQRSFKGVWWWWGGWCCMVAVWQPTSSCVHMQMGSCACPLCPVHFNRPHSCLIN